MTVSILPDSAPFNEEQRAWLNGFFAGMLGMEDGPSQSTDTPDNETVEEEEEDFPWHDAALPIDERMELADGKPVQRRMMAAMAQLDCGACGYVCKTYSEAIASGEEGNLTLCVPGGRETSKMLKKLKKDVSGDGSPSAPLNGQPSTIRKDERWTRANPYTAKLIESVPLNGEGSAKDTRHVAIDLGDSGLEYNVGDALGVYPTNCVELVDSIIAATSGSAESEVICDGNTKSLKVTLCEQCCLKEPTEELLEALLTVANTEQDISRLKRLVDDDSGLEDCDVLDVLQMFPKVTLSGQQLVDSLGSLNPRLYSIASSLRRHPGQVHLTVGRVTWEKEERLRKGVASTMLSDRIDVGGPLRVFTQKSHGFTVPADPDVPMIMVGPGTGIAPFLSFLQEREIANAKGDNWLFFGDQHRSCDFIYEDQMTEYLESGLLNRIDVAFSRDQEKKVYVQDRMLENGAEVWDWLDRGGYFFVCGDASRMAVDVDKALHEIVSIHGNMSAENATAYIKSMAKENRYSRDVY